MVLRVPRAQAIHLKPAADLADRVLLPGDPHRALAVAQSLLSPPRMFNHHRGLWGYTGEAPDGRPLTVQATGMGGPSAAVVVEELLDLGARTLVRIGTCGALDPVLELGDLLVATEALASDGTSRALGASDTVLPDGRLTAALLAGAGDGPPPRPAVVASTDLFYDDRDGAVAAWRERRAIAVEMEAAAVLRVAQRRGARAACVLAVSDLLAGGARRRIDREGIEAAGIRLGELAFAGLAAELRKEREEAV